jgi:Uma2 family endonuclease
MTTLDVLPIVIPADHVIGPSQGQWTYAAYAALPDDGHRYEIIDGVLYMAPAPTLGHQASNLRFARYLMQYVEDAGLGRVFPAPVDVELAPNVVLQPDVVVVLNANLDILIPARIIGAPDLVVEIASPGTAGYDRRQKQDAYARAGVPEYWIADPLARTVEVLRLNEGAYRSLGVFTGQAQLPSVVVPGLSVPVERFFA